MIKLLNNLVMLFLDNFLEEKKIIKYSFSNYYFTYSSIINKNKLTLIINIKLFTKKLLITNYNLIS
jgi:hypothetical protein